MYTGPRVRLRVIEHREAGRMLPKDLVQLEALNGAVYTWALAAEGFQAGDVVEVRRLERVVDGPAT